MDRRSIAFAAVLSMLLCTIGAHGKGLCQEELDRLTSQPMPGRMIPKCTDKGHYELIQTHGSTGYSWCVDPRLGSTIESTMTGPTHAPTCPQCVTLLAQSLEKILIGAYRPQCDHYGNFNQVQIAASTGMAWCANTDTGDRLTTPQRWDGTLRCDAVRNKRHAGAGQCRQAYENAMPQKPGEFRSQCTEKGHYQVVQHHGSTGYSWCVDPVSGLKIDGTDAAPGAQPSCPACVNLLSQSLEKILIGAYRPQCDVKTGNFKQVQFSASTGLAWCADPSTGEKLTKPVRHDGTLKCDARNKRHAGAGRCQQEYENAMPETKPGEFRSQCTEKGHYQVVQRHGSTGYSWCVDPVYGVKIEGSDVGPGAEASCPACVNLLAQSLEKILIGAYRPQCDTKSGNFKQVQFSASTGLAWCADPATGEKLTKPVRHDGTLKCNAVARSKRNNGRCQLEKEQGIGGLGAFSPSCTEKGHYNLIQHHGSSGYSWCVDPVSGLKIEGTQVGPTGGQPQCPACSALLSQSLEKILIGAYRPQCDTSGNFKPVQVSASTGRAWCADPATGKQLTQPVRWDGTLKC